jgi:hypothetical protein
MILRSRLSLLRPAIAIVSFGLVSLLAHCSSEPAPAARDAGTGGVVIPTSDGGCQMQTQPGPAPSMPSTCKYTDDTSFCACLGMHVDGGGQPFDCGGVDGTDDMGINHAAYCGACPVGQFCKSASIGDGFGHCTAGNPVQYAYQKQKMDMLVSMGEDDKPVWDHSSVHNIGDGRGYTISTVGFTTGTGDFIMVAACYNDAKPGNVLQKYWGHRDSSGRAIDGLIYYNELYQSSGYNQCDTSQIDSLGNFAADVGTAAADPVFLACESAISDAFYLAAAAQHATELGLTGALTIGFLYDTEINFGDADDPTSPGTLTVMNRANADYGAGLPTNFTGKPWEESRWLGLVIKERAIIMSKDPTWLSDMDQTATWEAARRQHTAASNTPESMTDLSMDYDIMSAYKAASTNSGPMNMTTNACPGPAPLTPCFGDPPLASNWDTCNGIWLLSTDKSADMTMMDPTKWVAAYAAGPGSFLSCPNNPTP